MRRRREPLSSLVALALLAAGLGVVFGTAGYLVQKSRNEAAAGERAGDPGYFSASGGGFDLDSAGGTGGGPAARAPAAAASSPLPVYSLIGAPAPAGAVAPAPAPALPVPPARAAALPTAAERATRADSRLTALLSAPAAFIARKTLLGSPSGLAGFVREPRRWASYLRHPLIAGVLSSPSLVRLVASPAVARAFVLSPAMRDPAAVKALAYSPLLQEIAAAPGVRANLKDPLFMSPILTDPAVAGWLAAHPDGARVVASLTAGGLAGRDVPLPR